MLDRRLRARVLQAVPETRRTLLSNSSIMPNWNYNSVEIHAPEHEVRKWLTENRGDLYFNMPMLFPERFPVDDPTGVASWDEKWACDNT